MQTVDAKNSPKVARSGSGPLPESTALLTGLGRVINMAALYGPEHQLTQDCVGQVLPTFDAALKNRRRVQFAIVDGSLEFDGIPVDSHTPLANTLTARLRELNVAGFTLLPGMSQGEFRNFVHILASLRPSTRQGAFSEALASGGVRHVAAESGVIRRVSAGNNGPAEGENRTGRSKTGTASEPDAVPAAGDIRVGQILAFLKGDVSATGGQAAKEMANMASSPEKLAQLIMEAAVIRQSSAGLASGESLADLVVGCLRRTVDAIASAQETKTQSGRAHAQKSLILLEQCILDRLHQVTQGPHRETDRAIEKLFREAKDDLELAAASSEYVHRSDALQKVEQWMLAYMKDRPAQSEPGGRMERHMIESGLSRAGWQELVMKCDSSSSAMGGVGSGVGAASAPAELGVLAMLLSQLDAMMQHEGDGAKRAVALAAEAEAQTSSLATKTSAKVRELGNKIGRTAVEPNEKSPAALLAEIAQELAQPVSVLNCVVEILVLGKVGAVSSDQCEILTTARACGRRATDLLDRLRHIVGVPASLNPAQDDRSISSSREI